MSNSQVRQYLPGDFTPGSFTEHNMDENSQVWKNIQHIVLKAVDACGFEPREGQPFRVAEFGANDGGTSNFIMTEIIDYIRAKYGEEIEIEIIYEDQPCNDFNSLFLLSHGLAPGPDPILLKKRNIFISAVGRSFHERCFPSDTIHLAISANSLHHLSESPCSTPDTHYPMLLPVDNPVLVKFASQARNDWKKFLLHRAKELVTGGMLVIAAFYHFPHPDKPGYIDFVNRPVCYAIDGLWQKMADEGLISQEEYKSANAFVYMCSVAEFRAPFDDPKSSVIKAGLRLLSITEHTTPRTKYADLSPREVAKRKTNAFRSFFSWPFLTALEQRPGRNKKKLIDQLFRGYEEELVHNVDVVAKEVHHAQIWIQKIQVQ